MARWARTDLNDMMTVKDLIDYQFLSLTAGNEGNQMKIFALFIALPFFGQVFIENQHKDFNISSFEDIYEKHELFWIRLLNLFPLIV